MSLGPNMSGKLLKQMDQSREERVFSWMAYFLPDKMPIYGKFPSPIKDELIASSELRSVALMMAQTTGRKRSSKRPTSYCVSIKPDPGGQMFAGATAPGF